MGKHTVKWGQVHRYFVKRYYNIKGSGGDKIIVAPKDGKPRSRNTVLIGHKCCSHAGDDVWPCYLQAIRRGFGVTAEEISND